MEKEAVFYVEFNPEDLNISFLSKNFNQQVYDRYIKASFIKPHSTYHVDKLQVNSNLCFLKCFK